MKKTELKMKLLSFVFVGLLMVSMLVRVVPGVELCPHTMFC